MQNERQVLLRPQRQSGHADNLCFHLYILNWEEDGSEGQLVKVENQDFLNYWNCIFVLQSKIPYLGCGEGGVRPFFVAALFGSQCSSYISLAQHTYLCYLLLLVLCLLKLWCRSSLFTLSTFWLGWKLTPLPSINLMEITDYWLFCLRIEV